MRATARLVLLLALLLGLQGMQPASAAELPPNLVTISPRLMTSGQPSAAWLETLKAQGFEAVVYLAPASVPDALREEPQIVAAQGLAFHHLPIPFGQPRAADYEAFARLMQTLAGRKVLVHCQVNMRASSLVFLYRVLVKRVPPEQAYEAVARVWSPDGPWKRLMVEELRRHGVAFDPF